MTDQEIEKEIQEKGLTAPRITPDHVSAVIASEYYFTAGDAIGQRDCVYESSLNLLTFCVLVLANGFTITGESACASPENFDAALGRKIARKNAVDKIWLLEGYLLKEKLWNHGTGPAGTCSDS